ncbi:MAG: T9SS type A sorting domain-containing protein [Bacteroidales bacterium]|jgi:hypothetical protein
MKKLFTTFAILLTLIGGLNRVSAQSTCVNADFSMGNFTDWTGSVGENTTGSGGPDYTAETGMIIGTPNQSPYAAGQQTIMNIAATDPNTNNLLNVLPPDGANSCMLGNAQVEACDGGAYPQAAQLNYAISPVTASNCIFTFQYAVVLQNPTTHTPAEMPKFTVRLLNAAGIELDSMIIIAKSGLHGFIECMPGGAVCESDSVLWKNWTTDVINLIPYIGQTITIQFTSYDCTPGGHFGYAYISCYCGISVYHLTQQCLGDSVIVSAPSGFSSYIWNTGDTTQSIVVNNPVSGDTVSCTFTFLNDTNTASAVISTIPVTGLTADSVTICRGDTAIITASGTYTYLWNTGQTGASIPVAPTVTTLYTVTATSSGGCTASATAKVTVNQLPNGTISSTPSSCVSPTGTITITPSAGTPPFTYIWNSIPPQTTDTAIGLYAGSYTVTITDLNGCSSAITGNVPSNVTINLTTSSTNEHCGEADGTATVSVSGGTSPYSYLWNTVPQQTTATAISRPSGTYTVTVTDAGSCTATATVTITDLPGPAAQITNIINDTCGLNKGSASLIVTSGTPPYTYLWNSSPAQTTPTLQNVSAGIYCVTVTDAYNCYYIACDTIGNASYPAPNICMVTTDSSSAYRYNEIYWDNTLYHNVDSFIVYRMDILTLSYLRIGAVSGSALSEFTDTAFNIGGPNGGNPMYSSWLYKLSIRDTCGNISDLSPYHQTMFVQESGANFSWNAYTIGPGQTNPVIGYSFLRDDNNTGNWHVLVNTAGLATTDPNYASYPNGNWRVDALGFDCTPSTELIRTLSAFSKSHSNTIKPAPMGIAQPILNNEQITVYPNPANDNITIENNAFTKGQTIYIYDIQGQLLIQQPMLQAKTNFDVSTFSKGVYFIKVENEKGIAVKKFIKE